MGDDLLIYGSYGYTGSMIAARAVGEGLSPTLAGRRSEPLERRASELGCDHRVFSLQHPEVVADRVGEYDVVLNCAGPFAGTAEPIVEACLSVGTDYLDIAGEVDVLEDLVQHDRDAEKAGTTLLPAVGFDVVPTDCLASYLHERLPSADRLTIALDGVATVSPGTVKSALEGLRRPGLVRQDGEIRSVPLGWKTRRVDFGQGEQPAVTVPWGDVSTAYYTTGIPNIETYLSVPEFALAPIRWLRPAAPVLATDPVRTALKAVADVAVSGPTPDERSRSVVRVWAEAEDEDGNRVVARLRTPNPYDLTAATAVESTRQVLQGEVDPGFQTPASAFDSEFVLEFDGVRRDVVTEHVEGVEVGEA